MADLGNIGASFGVRQASVPYHSWAGGDRFGEMAAPVRWTTAWNAGGLLTPTMERYRRQVTRDDLVGDPPPSLKVQMEIWEVRVPVGAGLRTISVRMLQPVASAVRPALRVARNPEVGLAADLIGTAGAATEWQTVSVTFTASAIGGVVVVLQSADRDAPCWFDNVLVT